MFAKLSKSSLLAYITNPAFEGCGIEILALLAATLNSDPPSNRLVSICDVTVLGRAKLDRADMFMFCICGFVMCPTNVNIYALVSNLSTSQ